MNNQSARCVRSGLWRRFGFEFTGPLVLTALLLLPETTQAGSAKWRPNAGSGDWNSATNWNPATVPNGPADIARFATSGQTAISISANTEISAGQFGPGANAFTITAPPSLTLTISGPGLTNSSTATQT